MKTSIVLVLAHVSLSMALTISGQMTFNRSRLGLYERDGVTVVSLERYTTTWQTGAPSLPIAVAQFVAPPNMKVAGVTVDAVESETIPGRFDVYPAQPPHATSDPGPFEFAPPDLKYYGSAYPAEVATAGHQGSMFGYNIASVFIAPVQYSGADRLLVFHPRVRFTIELEPADLGYLHPGNRSAEARRRVELQVAGIVLNPHDVAAYAPR
jgi:hypothetical protein